MAAGVENESAGSRTGANGIELSGGSRYFAQGSTKTRQVPHRAADCGRTDGGRLRGRRHDPRRARRAQGPARERDDDFFLADFKREARLAHRLEHPNILPIRDASFIDGRFVIAMPLGDSSLSSRMRQAVVDGVRAALDRAGARGASRMRTRRR